MRNLGKALLAVAIAAGCTPASEVDPPGSEEEKTYARFQAYVATANTCRVASECTRIVTTCPLGCYWGVRHDRKADVERKARELVAAYASSTGGSCVYRCVPHGPVTCVASRCRVDPVPFQRHGDPD